MEKKLVSVVVPIYNVEKYLDRCVESIVNQTYADLEIILVDDGSPDRCPEMCDAWAKKDARIKVIHKENAGLGMARNTGIEHASGDYICFFDSDDYVDLHTIEHAVKTAQDQSAQVVVFGMRHVGSKGNETDFLLPIGSQWNFAGEEVQRSFLPDLIDNRHCAAVVKNLSFSACCSLFEMKLVRETGWRFVSERELISEDSYSLIWLYRFVDNVVILPEAYYYQRENASSLTRTYREDRYQKIVHFYKACLKLVDDLRYSAEVRVSVSALYLSFAVAAMKQIVAADMGHRKKKTMLCQILRDDTLHQALADISDRKYGMARTILFWVMRRRWYSFCYALLVAQNIRQT